MTIDNRLTMGCPMAEWAAMDQLHQAVGNVGIPSPGSRIRHGSGGSAASSLSSGKCSPPALHKLFAVQADGAVVAFNTHPLGRLCASQVAPKPLPSSRYKTELCRPFEENGYCKYGDKCQFAHGGHEQRSLSRHPKYKTELCRTFHTVGFCPYGPRCHFIHNEDERKLGHINHIKHQQAIQQVAHHQMLSQLAAVPGSESTPASPQHARFLQPLPVSPMATATSPTIRLSQIPSPTFQLHHMIQPKSLEFSDMSPPPPPSQQPCIGPAMNTPPISPAASDQAAVSLPPAASESPAPETLACPLPSSPLKNSRPGDCGEEPLNETLKTYDLLKDIFSSPPSPPCSDEESCSPLNISQKLGLPIFS